MNKNLLKIITIIASLATITTSFLAVGAPTQKEVEGGSGSGERRR